MEKIIIYSKKMGLIGEALFDFETLIKFLEHINKNHPEQFPRGIPLVTLIYKDNGKKNNQKCAKAFHFMIYNALAYHQSF